jgi:hypothetical protein
MAKQTLISLIEFVGGRMWTLARRAELILYVLLQLSQTSQFQKWLAVTLLELSRQPKF